jgi:hypothetical protein
MRGIDQRPAGIIKSALLLQRSALAAYLLYELIRSVFRNYRGKLFQE